jgi:GNAT superfamily N-acetyltransferase
MMGETGPFEPQTHAGAGTATANWHVRPASVEDVAEVTTAVAELLVELTGTPPPASAMQAAICTLIEDRQAGALLVAEAAGALVGVLAASWQVAIHIPGRYALIQDLWVHHSVRGGGIGAGLLTSLFSLASEHQITRIEVGLPRESFAGIAATEAFYLSNGFTHLGPRMRRVLP